MKLLFVLLPMIIVFVIDFILVKKYGYPSLTLLSTKCYNSKHFKWLVWNVWGNTDWFFEGIISQWEGEKLPSPEPRAYDNESNSLLFTEEKLAEHLNLLIPAFGVLQISVGHRFIDALNDCLSETPFMYVLTGDGVTVALREQMLALGKAMFDKPMGDYGQ